MQISSLRDVPRLATAVADRCWHAWWTDTDVSLSEYQAAVERMTAPNRIPTAFVAHKGEQYAGSVLLIENDLEARPSYSPWIAALWVDPEFRGRRLAQNLITAARAEAGRLGFQTCYLCASEEKSPYYAAQGFRLVEANVSGLNVFTIRSLTEK